jgi:hypothetical protein
MWQDWARILHRWGMNEWVASFLEAAGPLTIFGAQVIYVSQPVLKGVIPNIQLEALTRLLEDTSRTQDFVSYLREAHPS